MWLESSSIYAANLAKKICNNSRDIEFFLGDYFLARPVHVYSRFSTHVSFILFNGLLTDCLF